MEYGPHAEAITNAALAKSQPIPADAIPPDLLPDCLFVYTAFQELSSDRQTGFGLGPVPWSAIDRYAIRYKIQDIDEFDSFVAMIRAMDTAYLNHHSKVS